MSNSQEITQFLNDLGLTKSESKVYLQLLESGPVTISDLSRKYKIPRTTIHRNIEKLMQRGLITQTIKGSRRIVIAENPNKINLLLMNSEYELEEKLKKVNKLKKLLPDFVSNLITEISDTLDNNEVFIRYYEGENGFREICQRSIDSSTSEVLFISNMNEWRKVYTIEYGKKYYVPERLKKKLFLKTLAVPNQEGSKMKDEDSISFRETRFLPKTFDFKSTIIVCDKEVSIMKSSQPYISILIQDKDFANIFRLLFNYLWKTSK